MQYFRIDGTVFNETTPFLISPKGERRRSAFPLGVRMGRGLRYKKQIALKLY